MPERKHTIAVKCEVGDRVMVKNYRRRPARWEAGEVEYVEADIYNRSVHLRYTVLLERRTENGPIRLYVSDDGVWREARDGA